MNPVTGDNVLSSHPAVYSLAARFGRFCLSVLKGNIFTRGLHVSEEFPAQLEMEIRFFLFLSFHTSNSHMFPIYGYYPSTDRCNISYNRNAPVLRRQTCLYLHCHFEEMYSI